MKEPRVIYEMDVWCVYCRRRVRRYVSWKSPEIGDRTDGCWCESHTGIGVIDSVEWAGEITDRGEIEKWVDRVYESPDIEHDDAYEAFAPHRPEIIEKVVKKKVWLYPVGSLRNLREREARNRSLWELEKVEMSDDPGLGRFLFTFRWKGGGVGNHTTRVYANGEHEAWVELEP